MESDCVATEIANAREREASEKRQVLFPIRLVDYERIQAAILTKKCQTLLTLPYLFLTYDHHIRFDTEDTPFQVGHGHNLAGCDLQLLDLAFDSFLVPLLPGRV